MNTHFKKTPLRAAILSTFVIAGLSACSGDSYNDNTPVEEPPVEQTPVATPKSFNVVQGNDLNSKANALLSANPGGPGGSPNQGLRGGDVLLGEDQDDIIIGGLGVDVMLGDDGDDIMIGGTEDFNSSVDGDDNGSDNRDRALGQDGDDTFIWAPGDGSDFFDGGDGIDVVIFGLLGELTDSDGNTDGAPFFGVNPPGSTGSQDFDGIFLDANNQPVVSVSGSPGFCSVLDNDAYPTEFELLDIDNIVRFSLRGIANAFDDGTRTDDDGLRVAVTLKNTEYLVCTTRVIDENNSENNIQVLDISGDTPAIAAVTDLPEYVQALIQ